MQNANAMMDLQDKQISFWESVEWFSISPRINRIKFLGLYSFWFGVCVTIILIVKYFESPYAVYLLLLAFPNLFSLTIRRLNDINRSGWWTVLGLIPVLGQMILLALLLMPGNKGANRFGEKPKPTLRRYYYMMLATPIMLIIVSQWLPLK